MGNHKIIWDHEKAETRKIAESLVQTKPDISGWRVIKLPLVGAKLLHWRHKVRLAQKNLLFTRELAFEAAKAVDNHAERSLELGRADLKTREVLNKEKEGFYSEKIRKRQLIEIETLFDHYLKLMQASGATFEDLIRSAYENKEDYEGFLKKLEEKETAVIQAALSSMRKASKKERTEWFNKVQKLNRQSRRQEVENIYPE